MHNFSLSYDELTKVFQLGFLHQLDDDFKKYNDNHKENLKIFEQNISFDFALQARNKIDHWKDRQYPATVEENKKILDDYLTLLEKCNIQPILFLPPMVKEYEKNFSKEKIDELFAYLNELYRRHNFIFVNGWAMNDFDDHDFFDIDHLNINGARKFSSKLNEIIMKLERQ